MHTKLNRQQITGFWAAWTGWTLDGMDSVIYALVLAPALTELLPRSGMEVTPARIGYVGSVMFALFLVGWGCAFIWGPVADKFGRTKALAATILVYALFTGASAFAQNIWELGAFRLLAGIGVGGDWAMAGTYVAQAWPEDRRAMGAGYFGRPATTLDFSSRPRRTTRWARIMDGARCSCAGSSRSLSRS